MTVTEHAEHVARLRAALDLAERRWRIAVATTATPRQEAAHGTDSGYFAWGRWHTDPCPACTTAHRIAERDRARRARKASE